MSCSRCFQLEPAVAAKSFRICLLLLFVITLGIIGFFIYMLVKRENSAEHENIPDSLVMVHVIFRHGEKVPDKLSIFPKSPYINETFYPYGLGQLTDIGKKNAYFLGEQLHKRYGQFLGKTYYPGIINGISSDRPRCEMTLSLLLAALFPPSKEQTIVSSLAWQPILFKSVPADEDKIISIGVSCPDAFNLPKSNSMEDLEFFQFLEENTGYVIENLRPTYYISVYLKEIVDLGFPVPEWAKQSWSQIQYLGKVRFWSEIVENNLPLLAGHLMDTILNNTRDTLRKLNDVYKTKIYLYSGHTQNIVAVLGALKCYHKDYIKYSSQVILEVHLINGTYGIKAFFQNGPNSRIKPLGLPFCGEFCPLEVFEDYQNRTIISKKC